jgi:hypothetical protein
MRGDACRLRSRGHVFGRADKPADGGGATNDTIAVVNSRGAFAFLPRPLAIYRAKSVYIPYKKTGSLPLYAQ